MAMELQPQDIEVGCILQPRREVGATRARTGPNIVGLVRTGVPYQWSPPTRIKNDKRGTEYSPIGHYFPTHKEEKKLHPKKYRSRYWLRGENFSETTLNEARSQRVYQRTIELRKYSMLRLPHVFTQPLSKFEPFGGCNSRAMDYCLDKSSYYRLMGRLGLRSGNDRSDIIEPGTHNNSIFSSISQLFNYLGGVYNSTEDDPSQSQAEPIYPGDDCKSLLFSLVSDILSMAELNLSSGVECFTKAKSTGMGLELA
ncbi:predicted protein [Sclerotinia sclerotiorum 1980 UF-70]|uniref:Uncharacterized protein n=2 Tax=Sclerotinia sclerotiorum (strain ATCC 18683 / 1980 / Ss-1) TaxID=665079 RepID=A7EIR1_SCLS1|nr:predicted protein [Sclerotinia sclerotiorum 1980 UF-70]APA11724.1 hypothetical protein sscle_08g064940 [Sclerotinia sclerotiorum 1980 UF-70]EDO02727.1 predicted protein [Sclerotinia sclerotiorum 1980 UF-70]